MFGRSPGSQVIHTLMLCWTPTKQLNDKLFYVYIWFWDFDATAPPCFLNMTKDFLSLFCVILRQAEKGSGRPFFCWWMCWGNFWWEVWQAARCLAERCVWCHGVTSRKNCSAGLPWNPRRQEGERQQHLESSDLQRQATFWSSWDAKCTTYQALLAGAELDFPWNWQDNGSHELLLVQADCLCLTI